MSEVVERVVTAASAERERASVSNELGSPGREVPAYSIVHWQGRLRDYCVIIPVINEGERIGRLLARMAKIRVADRADIIIVDGGSTDDSLTPPILASAAVRGLLLKTGPGKLSAQLRCAYAFALEQGYAGIITIDGNDKDDPQSLPAFISALEQGYDFVQASRFIEGAIEEHTPWKRRIAIRWVHAPLTSLAGGFDWTDTTQGYRGYSRRLLESPEVAPFRHCFKDYELLAYLSCRAPQLGFRCIELPTARRYPLGEAIPTKIGSLRGELAVLETLLSACVGRFDPGARSINPRLVAWGAVAGVLLIAMALRVFAWALHRDFWIDEAMLYAAIEAESVLRPWAALPLFEQSCPYVLALMWKTLINLFGPNELLLRLPSLLASMSALVALTLVARRLRLGPMGTGATLAIAGLSEVAIVQSAQLKQYSFELLATTLVLLTAERALRQVRNGHLPISFLVISILMLPVSYAVPIITAACAVAVLLAVRLSGAQRSPLEAHREPTQLWQLGLLAVPWAASVLLWHHYVVTPSTHFQFTAYPYAQYFLALTDRETWRNLGVVMAPLKPHLGTVWASDVAVPLVAMVWMAGLIVGWKRHAFIHGVAFVLISFFIVLSISHLLPLAASRHFLFAMPIFALSFGAALQALSTAWQARGQMTARGIAVSSGVFLLILTSGLLRAAEVPGEEVRKALISASGKRCHTIWAYYGAWPAVLVYRKDSNADFLGEVAARSASTAWTASVRDNFEEYVLATRNSLLKYPEVCLLFSHARETEQDQVVAAINSTHICNTTHEGIGVSLHECRHRPTTVVNP